MAKSLNPPKTFFDLVGFLGNKEPVEFKQYAGKPTLVVNVASECGYTDDNYKALADLHAKYRDRVHVLAFPCNQFGRQEPGSYDQIEDFVCTKYKATFPIFDKGDVNGVNAQPVFKFLKSQKGGDVKWNFEKFLVDGGGRVVKRYGSDWTNEIEQDIQALLVADKA